MGLLVSTSFNAFKAGLAAATVGKLDAFLLEFIESINPPVDAPQLPLSWRSLILSPFLAQGRSVRESLAHPLLKLVATHYLHSPLQKDTILTFFHEQLSEFGLRSEVKCPTTEKHLVGWLRNALEYGRRTKAEDPQRIKDIFGEIGEDKVDGVRELVDSVVRKAGGTESRATADAILKWHRTMNETYEPAPYGRRLERIVHCADFAIWTSWVA